MWLMYSAAGPWITLESRIHCGIDDMVQSQRPVGFLCEHRNGRQFAQVCFHERERERERKRERERGRERERERGGGGGGGQREL